MPENGVQMRMASAEDAIRSGDRRLIDLVDGLLDKGVVVSGELWLTVADVDLVYLGLNAVLATPDRIRKTEDAA